MAKALNVQTGKIEDATASTDTISEEDQLTELRLFRNNRLAASDWTQAADAPLTDAKKEEWKVYRQELRDITKTQKSLVNITWPALSSRKNKWL